jgi:hypothetical protein
MKRDVSIHAVENGWVVTDATAKGTWVFNSTAGLVRDLPAILETEAGPKPPVQDLSDVGTCPPATWVPI